MKKKNVFYTFIFICLAMMVAVVSVLGFSAQMQPIRLAAANNSTALFDAKGNYAVSRTAITKGRVFNFFGYDWRVVYVNGDVATFWMVDPYTTHAFNTQTVAGDQSLLPNNLWRNGYTSSTAGSLNQESDIRAFLREEAKRIIDNKDYKAYSDKVMPGYQAGSNLDNGKAYKTIKYDENVQIDTGRTQDGKPVTVAGGVYYANSGTTNFYPAGQNWSMAVDYSLSISGTEDRLWLPAVEEVMDGGLWGLDTTSRNWHNTANGNLAWLRTADSQCNFRAWAVAYNPALSSTGFKFAAVDQSNNNKDNYTFGVRPAIHMNIASANPNVGNGSDNGKNGGWFTDDMMKVFFIVICVLGVIGIVLVVVAVVNKARANKQQQRN